MSGYECTNVEQVGANAFTCDWATSVSTPSSWYNASMHTNKTYYYDNYTRNIGYPGLFLLKPLRKLEEDDRIVQLRNSKEARFISSTD